MKIRINISIFVVLLASGGVMVPLSLAQNRRMTIRVGEIRNPPPLEPQAGDRFQIDAEGDIVIEHKNQAGQIQRRRILRGNKVSPEIITGTEIAGSQSVRYNYSVANGSGARQSIYHFAIGASRPDLITQSLGPAKWYLRGSPVDSLSRYNWTSLETSTDIAPGGGAVQAGFHAPLLPGLMKAYFSGRLSQEEAVVEIDGWRLSPWLGEKVHEALMYQNNTLQIPVIGPKFEIASMRTSGKLAAAIGGELLAAAAMPEFQVHRLFLENTGAQVTTAGRSASGLSRTIGAMGETPLQKSFFRAMALNLEYLERLP
jgi:hypothetical protein